MVFIKGIVLLIALSGCVAIPPPLTEDLSIFFDHPDPADSSDPTSRIVGGTVAPAGSAAYSVALTTGTLLRSFTCGGSLIARRTVLTAAHCIAGSFSWGSLTSSLRGTVGSNRWNSGGTTFAFLRNVTHQHYVSGRIKNDIGLLITRADVTLTATVAMVPLSFDFVTGDVPVKVAGWGRIRNGGALSTQLLELFTSTLTGEQCVNAVAQASVDFNIVAPPVEPHIELCTFHSAGHGNCHGDSGSALVRVDNGQQVGVVSWGFPCARGAPDMFARVSAFSLWLTEHTV